MYAYRITFGHDKAYKMAYGRQAEACANFAKVHQEYYPIVQKLKRMLKACDGVKYCWHFYEPYVELTWYQEEENSAPMTLLVTYLELNDIEDFKTKIDKTGNLADWFCCNNQEREFGGKCHSLCSEMVDLMWEYREAIEAGKGTHEQMKRNIHRMCNPLGINYMDEAKICFSRGLICVLFRFFSFKRAVWIYKKIFRQKY